MSSEGQNVVIDSGDDHTILIDVKDDAGNDIDITGANEITYTAHPNNDPLAAAVITKTLGGGEITVTTPTNRARVVIIPGDTSALSGEFFHKLVIEDAASLTSHTTKGVLTVLPFIPVIVRLQPDLDYLKRLKEIVPSGSKGTTRTELNRASKSAEDDIFICLAQIGFDTVTFTTMVNTPHTVQEIIMMLASARVWNRMLLEYNNDTPFEETFGAALLKMANKELEKVADRRMLRDPVTGAMIVASLAEKGKGAPNFRSPKIFVKPNSQIVIDSDIDDFIQQHGASPAARSQADDFRLL